MNVLLITSSPRGADSVSSKVARELAAGLGGDLVARDLWSEGIEPIGPAFVQAVRGPGGATTPEEQAALDASEQAISELFAADVLVIGAGMINFGMPATLKTWIDLVCRAGRTFRYSESGPEGLLKGKRAVLVLAAGGVYSDGPMAAFDHLQTALKQTLGFLGITDVETVWIEGLALGEESAQQALERANIRTREILAAAS